MFIRIRAWWSRRPVLELLQAINRKVDQIMTDLTGLSAAIDRMEQAGVAAVTELRELRDEIEQLQEGTITQEQIDSLAGRATAAAEALATATTEDDQPPAGEEQPPAGEAPAGETPGETPSPGEEPPAGETPPAEEPQP